MHGPVGRGRAAALVHCHLMHLHELIMACVKIAGWHLNLREWCSTSPVVAREQFCGIVVVEADGLVGGESWLVKRDDGDVRSFGPMLHLLRLNILLPKDFCAEFFGRQLVDRLVCEVDSWLLFSRRCCFLLAPRPMLIVLGVAFIGVLDRRCLQGSRLLLRFPHDYQAPFA